MRVKIRGGDAQCLAVCPDGYDNLAETDQGVSSRC